MRQPDPTRSVKADAPESPDIHFIKRTGPASLDDSARACSRLAGDASAGLMGIHRGSPLTLGAFPGSFNPITTAHIELIRRASEQFSLDEVVLLAGTANADKRQYECDLQDRLQMLTLALEDVPNTSIGICRPVFFVDMIESLRDVYSPDTEIHFIMGKDTLERLLDPGGKYLDRYRRDFATASEAVDYLLSTSRLIVADRAYRDSKSVEQSLGERLAEALVRGHAERVLTLDFPLELAERSATQVREAIRAGAPIRGLVPPRVEAYIRQRGLYS
jgi:nicotinate-nucleotide adenylyltransferase